MLGVWCAACRCRVVAAMLAKPVVALNEHSCIVSRTWLMVFWRCIVGNAVVFCCLHVRSGAPEQGPASKGDGRGRGD